MKKGKAYRRSNPRDVLNRLILEFPKARKAEHLALFMDHVNGRDGKGALDSVAEYWFEANYSRLKGDQP